MVPLVGFDYFCGVVGHDERATANWVDMEMTGLDPDTDVVIEIASIVTTKA